MEHRHQNDTSTPDPSIGSLPVEWLLEESRQLREEQAALLNNRHVLLHRRDLLFRHQLLLIARLRISGIEAPKRH